ncbi:hypothetical protein BDZ91DRAFT_288232 [Kalaharituber pfeilii]|nr:hypothetical protein BDZ91DRAFT_288232 [Kalaharituber pfeilii]
MQLYGHITEPWVDGTRYLSFLRRSRDHPFVIISFVRPGCPSSRGSYGLGDYIHPPEASAYIASICFRLYRFSCIFGSDTKGFLLSFFSFFIRSWLVGFVGYFRIALGFFFVPGVNFLYKRFSSSYIYHTCYFLWQCRDRTGKHSTASIPTLITALHLHCLIQLGKQ